MQRGFFFVRKKKPRTASIQPGENPSLLESDALASEGRFYGRSIRETYVTTGRENVR